jgi:hypothetical protein
MWRQDGPVWVRTGEPVALAGRCGEADRYIVFPPGGTIRIGELVVEVTGAVDPIPTAWPPGFPALADGVHTRVPTPEGTASVVVDDLPAALRAAGWQVDPSGVWATRDGVLVRFSAETLSWRTRAVPLGSWWTLPDACPGDARPVDREAGPGTVEHVCVRPDGVADGPATTEWSGGASRGWYSEGELHGDWLDIAPGGYGLRTYAHGRPVGHWEIVESGVKQADGWYVDGARDGVWTTAEPGGPLEVQTYCAGVRCGVYRRTHGILVQTGAYADDLRTGPWRTTMSGVVVEEGTWVDGHPVGVVHRTQTTGVPFSVEVYDALGRQDGVWLEYDAYGEVARRSRWRRGELVRSRTWDR